MLVELHNSFGQPTRLPATRIVIYDDKNNPIGIFLQTRPGEVMCEVADNPAFPKLLRELGINKTVVVDIFKPSLVHAE